MKTTLRLFIITLLIVNSVKAQSKKHRITHDFTVFGDSRTKSVDSIDRHYCWKELSVLAYSYIDSIGDLKWKYCDKINQVAIETVYMHKSRGIWYARISEFPEFYDMDLYYIDNKRIYPVDIKLKPNCWSPYTGYFKDLPK